MQSEIKIGQRFKFNLLSDDPGPERHAVVTRVLSDSEEGLGPEVDFYFAYWVEAHELAETEVPTSHGAAQVVGLPAAAGQVSLGNKLIFQRGTDGNAYLEGCQVSITLLK